MQVTEVLGTLYYGNKVTYGYVKDTQKVTSDGTNNNTLYRVSLFFFAFVCKEVDWFIPCLCMYVCMCMYVYKVILSFYQSI